MTVPGFFKRGFYAKRIRALIDVDAGAVMLDGVDDTPALFTATDTSVKPLQLSVRKPEWQAVEYEAFGIMEGIGAGQDDWTVEVVDPSGSVLKTVQLKSLARSQFVQLYIRGRQSPPNRVGIAGYHLSLTLNIGTATMRILSARLYGIK